MRAFLCGVGVAFLCFVVVAGPALAQTPPPSTIGPGDFQNKPFADAHYATANNYRSKALEYKTAYQGLPASCQAAITSAQSAYTMRMYMGPPLTQAQKDAYAAKIAAATNSKYLCAQSGNDAQQMFDKGDEKRVYGDWLYVNEYFYEAGRNYYWCYGGGVAIWQDYESFPEDDHGYYPFASLRWAQGATWHQQCIAYCNEARAALSP